MREKLDTLKAKRGAWEDLTRSTDFASWPLEAVHDVSSLLSAQFAADRKTAAYQANMANMTAKLPG
ncbi:MAG TPA: hypothetical protein VIS99_08955 [Terrimicrobiaceae bacterium]